MLIKKYKYSIINKIYGDVMVSTLHQKCDKQVVDLVGHLKKREIKNKRR